MYVKSTDFMLNRTWAQWARFFQNMKKITNFFLGHLYSFSIQGKFSEESESGEKIKKKKKFLGLNCPFTKVVHFENIITTKTQLLTGSKIKFSNTPK